MADTTTSVVQIFFTDESGRSKSFNIDNPRENLTLNQIRQAFQSAINGRWWYGNNGTVISALKSANYSQSVKIPIEGQDVVIEITPSTIEFQPTSSTAEAVNDTVTVSGSEVIGAYVTGFSGQNTEYLVAQAYPENSQVTVSGELIKSYTTKSCTLNIVTAARTVTIPINISPVS